MYLRRRKYGDELTEAGDVKFNELEAESKKKINAIKAVTGLKPTSYQSGMSGDIVMFKKPAEFYRLNAEMLKKLVTLKVRWVAMPGLKEVAIGL